MYETIWKHEKIAFGGDYNPEQWDEATWAEDMRLFRLAGIDTVTLNVFSWAALQPSEDVYDFSKLDRIMQLCRENGLRVILATSTAAHPAWMAKKYPEILRTEPNGMRRKFGSRHNSCPNSPIYRKFSAALAEKLARRYGKYDNVIAWHISNEYGGECICENCAGAFRRWLKERYGTIDALNRAWDTAFWSHTFYDWDEIEPASYLTEHWGWERTTFQGISLDYRRFQSDSLLACCRLEAQTLKKITPDIPVTTNFMEFYKQLDYRKWAQELDFVSWDSYPSPDATPARMAMNHELFRGLKQGRPFALMEQTPSVTNWQPFNALKRPGVMRLWSYQAVAHGSDSVLFFQMRRSIGACEKYHGAIIDHCGHENTRVFREAAQLGAELKTIGAKLLATRTDSRVGIVFDWENWWAAEYSAGPTTLLRYVEEVERFYTALHGRNIAVDLVSTDDDLGKYDLVIAPVLYMVKSGVDEKLRAYVQDGGTLVTTYFSGYVDESDLVTVGGYPGKLRDILGIWVEETDAQPAEHVNHFTYRGRRYACDMLFDLLHSEGAEVLARYEEDFYAEMPALTKHGFGRGQAYYMATRPEAAFYDVFLSELCAARGIEPTMHTPAGVEATVRHNEKNAYLFLLNHTAQQQCVRLPHAGRDILTGREAGADACITLEKYGVAILEYAYEMV